MGKWATYSIVFGLIAIVAPYVLSILGWNNTHVSTTTPVIAMVAGTLGVLMHVYLLIQAKKLSGNATILLISILLVFYGLALQQLKIDNATYLSLVGVMLIAIWIAIPTKRS